MTQSIAYHVEGVSPQMLHNQRRDQCDAPFGFWIIRKISAEQRKHGYLYGFVFVFFFHKAPSWALKGNKRRRSDVEFPTDGLQLSTVRDLPKTTKLRHQHMTKTLTVPNDWSVLFPYLFTVQYIVFVHCKDFQPLSTVYLEYKSHQSKHA